MNDRAELDPARVQTPTVLPNAARPSAGYAKSVLGWTVVLLAVCLLSGRWQPHLVSDSASYQQYPFSSLEAMARYSRLPAYPALLRAAGAITSSEAAGLYLVVFTQIVLHAIAVSFFMIELRQWGLSRGAAMGAAAAVAIGCPFWDNVSTISTDCSAMSLGVITATCILRGWRIGFSVRLAVGVAMGCVLAVSLRPAYLFLLPWAIVMLLFRAGDGTLPPWTRRWRDVAVVGALPLIILLAWCSFRHRFAGDFSVLPFGHQNMAAVTTQLLDNDELQRMSGPVGELASEMGRRRVVVANDTQGRASHLGSVPLDGLDLRVSSDPALRADSYMTLENRWDAMTYLVVIPAAVNVAGDDPIAQHRLLAQLDSQIVRAYPWRYARWWLLAMRRGIWGSVANIVMHPIFLIAIVLAAGVSVVVCIWPRAFVGRGHTAIEDAAVKDAMHFAPGRRAVTLIAISYAASGLAFVALTSPTIGRFSDAAFVFMPSLIAIAMVSHGMRLSRFSRGSLRRECCHP